MVGRRDRRPFSTWGGPTETAGDAREAAALGALAILDPAVQRELTHPFHPYAGRMPPSLARGAIARLTRPGDLVLDPFCGSGTVLIEAYAAGRRALGLDASPLAVALARVRTRTLGEAGRAELVERAAAIAAASHERVRRKVKPAFLSWSAEERTRFAPHVLLELLGLRELLGPEAQGGEDAEDGDVLAALRMCFSSILTKVMRGAPPVGEEDTHAENRVARGFPSRIFADRAAELAEGLEALDRAVAAHGVERPRIRSGDARRLEGVPDAGAQLVLTSPPYAGVYDYGAHHDVRFRWLGLDEGPLAARHIGKRDAGPGTSPARWLRARHDVVKQMARVLAPGGAAVLVVGDGVVGDRPEDARAEYEAEARSAGLTVVASASQPRPNPDRQLGAIFGARERREHILLWRKPDVRSR